MAKLKDKKNSSTTNQRAETIQDIYGQGEVMRVPTRALNWVAVIIIALVLGVVGGYLGGWLQTIWQPTWLLSNAPVVNEPTDGVNIIDLGKEQNKLRESFDQLTLNNLSAQTVAIYRSRPRNSEQPLQGVLTDKDLAGQGIIITSDGWIISHDGVIKDVEADYLVITTDRQGLAVEQIIADDFTGLVFIKVAGQNLRPAVLKPASTVSAQQGLMIVRQTLQPHEPALHFTRLSQWDYKPLREADDYFHSTEKLDSWLRLSSVVEATFNGSPIATAEGDIVGLLRAEAGESLGIPGFYLQLAVSNFLSNRQEPVYNRFGISYLDLAEVVGLPPQLLREQGGGALIYAPGSQKAVIANSPAAKSNLQKGDIILAVDDQMLNASVSLMRVLQEYPLGSTVKMKVLKTGQTEPEEIIVILSTK
ncbi:MAG: PDZ domain-containing protein [Candidatus Komeilibacteria bacterium]|nr:PDZ domain-containing protein [Candidatus Komeilibacteria bacterium]